MKASNQDEELINVKMKSLEQEASSHYNHSDLQSITSWIIKYGFSSSLSIPRFNHLETIKQIMLSQGDQSQSLFNNDNFVCELLENSKELYDLAFVIKEYLSAKKSNTVQSQLVLSKLQKKFGDFIESSQDIQSTLYIQNLFLFILMRQVSPKQSSLMISSALFIRQRVQSAKIYEYVLKPLFEKKNLSKYYSKLVGLAAWLVIMDPSKLQLIYDLGKKINIFIIYDKSESSIEMINVCNTIFDLLSVKFPRESELSHQNLAALLFRITKIPNFRIQAFFQIWMQARHKCLDTIDFQNMLRVLTIMGASNLVIQILNTLWRSMLKLRKYNILLKIFSNYIRPEFTKFSLKSTEDMVRYIKLIKLFMIGLSNRERFQGEEIDQLTKNICLHATKKGISLTASYRIIIEIYSIYQNRFSFLSEVSKIFFQEIQHLAKLKLQVAEIHTLYDQFVIREMGIFQDDEWQSRKTSNRYRGIENVGNTCYMNAFMQALYMTKKFRALIHSITQNQSLPSHYCKIYALQFLFQELTKKQFEQLEAVKPDYFRSELPQPFKSSHNQQDSAQFGRIYVQQLSNQLQKDNNQKIDKLLMQKLSKIIRCIKCNQSKTQQESIFDLILRLEQGQSTICVSRLIVNYFQPEKFTNDNRIYCSNCKSKNDAISELTPNKFTDILVLSLSIFQFEEGSGKKILLPLTFEFTLNIGTLLNNPDLGEYQLYAFIVHMGSMHNSGHYVCYARNLQQNPMIWYNLNDGYVEQLQIGKPQEFGFSENQTPYMLFYSKKNTLSASRTIKS